MRVALLGLNYSPEPTGNAPYTSALAAGLAARGHQVRVFTAHPHYPEWRIRDGYGAWRSREWIDGVAVTRLRHYVPRQLSNVTRSISELSFGGRLLAEPWGVFDVALFVSPALLSTSVAALRLRLRRERVPYGVWVQDLYSLGVEETGAGGSLASRAMRRVESSTLRGATSVVAIHPRFRDYIVSGLGVPSERVEVIRNWTHLRPSRPVERETVRERLGWRPNEIIVLHAGNQGAKQGLENVVEAARVAEAQNLPVRFVLLGKGNQRASLEAQSAGVTRISFVDPLPDAEYQAAMAAADVLLLNERPGVSAMAVPSKLTSYFSAGRPVVAATDFGSVTAGEIGASGGGIRVDAGEPRQLAEAVMELARDPERCSKLGAAGGRYCSTVLGQDAAINHFEEWLKALVDS